MQIELMCGTTVLCVQNNDSVQKEGSSSFHIGYEQCAFDMDLWTIQIMLSLIYKWKSVMLTC